MENNAKAFLGAEIHEVQKDPIPGHRYSYETELQLDMVV
jgi:hypothetical protein